MSLNLNHIFKVQKWMSFFLDPEKKKLIYITVKKLYFSFCLVICTFSFGKVSKLINRIHKKKNIRYSVWWFNDVGSTFQEVLQPSVSVHHMQSPNFPEKMKQKKNKNFDLVSKQHFTILRNWVSLNIKSLPEVNIVKSKIKYWKWNECPCKLFKNSWKYRFSSLRINKNL